MQTNTELQKEILKYWQRLHQSTHLDIRVKTTPSGKLKYHCRVKTRSSSGENYWCCLRNDEWYERLSDALIALLERCYARRIKIIKKHFSKEK